MKIVYSVTYSGSSNVYLSELHFSVDEETGEWIVFDFQNVLNLGANNVPLYFTSFGSMPILGTGGSDKNQF